MTDREILDTALVVLGAITELVEARKEQIRVDEIRTMQFSRSPPSQDELDEERFADEAAPSVANSRASLVANRVTPTLFHYTRLRIGKLLQYCQLLVSQKPLNQSTKGLANLANRQLRSPDGFCALYQAK